jgi:putative transposase
MPTILKAFRFALEPTTAQKETLSSWAPALRFLWNWMLAQRRDAYKGSEGRVRIGYNDQAAQLPAMKAMFPWLAALPSQPLQQTLLDLDTAFKNFFEGRAAYPAFKSKLRGDPGIRWPQGVGVNGRAVWLPKLGWVKARFSCRIQGVIKSATVRHDGLRWFVSILCESEPAVPVEPSGASVGIDVGVQESIALSDGRLLQLPVATEKEDRRQQLLARRVSRCVPGSHRHAKAKRRLLVFRRGISNRVQDTRHKLTTNLAKNHGLIVVEALTLKSLTRSARGTVEAPGKNVAAKSGLNRSLLAQGHAETIRQLDYKTKWLGGELREVNPAYTSQTCPQCGHVAAENRPSRAVFRCVQCSHTGHADLVAASNILAAGLAASARGASTCRGVESGTRRKAAKVA